MSIKKTEVFPLRNSKKLVGEFEKRTNLSTREHLLTVEEIPRYNRNTNKHSSEAMLVKRFI